MSDHTGVTDSRSPGGPVVAIKGLILAGLVVAAVLSGRTSGVSDVAMRDLDERVTRLERLCGEGTGDDLASRLRAHLDRVDLLTTRLAAFGRRPGSGGEGTSETDEPIRPTRVPIEDRRAGAARTPTLGLSPADRARGQILTNTIVRQIEGLSKDQHVELLEVLTDIAMRTREVTLKVPPGPNRVAEILDAREEVFAERNRRVREFLEPEQYEEFLRIAPTARPGPSTGRRGRR